MIKAQLREASEIFVTEYLELGQRRMGKEEEGRIVLREGCRGRPRHGFGRFD